MDDFADFWRQYEQARAEGLSAVQGHKEGILSGSSAGQCGRPGKPTLALVVKNNNIVQGNFRPNTVSLCQGEKFRFNVALRGVIARRGNRDRIVNLGNDVRATIHRHIKEHGYWMEIADHVGRVCAGVEPTPDSLEWGMDDKAALSG